jgi:general secretion pathway protein M
LGPGLSRILALALLAFLCVAAFQLIAFPVFRVYPEVARRIEEAQTSLRRYQALSAQGAQLLAHLQAAKNVVANSLTYLKGSSHTLAGAELQNQVRNIVEAAGGELRSSQILPAEANENKNDIRRVIVRAQIGVSMGRLQELLYNIETNTPGLFIHEILIHQDTDSGLGEDQEIDPMLEVMVEIYGFLALEAPS